ncbi:ComF family protein [Aeromonas bivalvium]|uniref:ComF family protein n=1 Tax=Aeromonas bivalvium TaxID=440079 RepID=UPI0038CF76ED
MLKRLLAKASPMLGTSADWLGHCLLCRQPCTTEPLLCHWCRVSLRQSSQRCQLCAAPLTQPWPLCGRCQRRPPPWDRLQVIGDYQAPYPWLIPRLKYGGDLLLAPLLARLLADHLVLDNPPEAILPVPLHWWRQWRRGFNQAQLIGTDLSRLTGIPLDTGVIRRIRATPQQTQLSAGERRRNLKGAFALAPHPYRHVALLDDVVTTGATTGQLSRLLRHSGIEKIEVWALCRTLPHPRG